MHAETITVTDVVSDDCATAESGIVKQSEVLSIACTLNTNNGNNQGETLTPQNEVAQENSPQLLKLAKKMNKRGRPKGAQLFVELHVVTCAMTTDSLIEESEVEVRPAKVPIKCLDENVYIHIPKFFTYDACSLVNDVIGTLQTKVPWTGTI
uniref:Uncharacterized protein n=1 Tax=Amphimedon queenslandica TaxID=400682 RepID=A0A1X7UJV0_AMPQE